MQEQTINSTQYTELYVKQLMDTVAMLKQELIDKDLKIINLERELMKLGSKRSINESYSNGRW